MTHSVSGRILGLLTLLALVSSLQVRASGQDEPEKNAWEYDPYRIAVWIGHDNSHKLIAGEQRIISEVSMLARTADPSGWQVDVRRAPNPWNWRIIGDFDKTAYVVDLKRFADEDSVAAGEAPETLFSNYDKLMIVGLRDEFGKVRGTVQELDLKTEVWGAEVQFLMDYPSLTEKIYDGIRTAFMPLTRIERVSDLDVRVRVRASGIVNRPEVDANGNWSMVPNVGSPVWIGDQEILLPVSLRKDRRGNVSSITAIDWTFLSIVDRDGPFMNCTTHATARTPLGGRTGGRLERLALCVRAPNRPTTLKLISRDDEAKPLPDLEIFSRLPSMTQADSSEQLESTDWKGEVVIPPNQEGIRILYVKSGQRALARVPVVPGLYPYLTAAMPDDERRLYAEGIVRGLQNQLMDYVARRQVLKAMIERQLEQGNITEAREVLRELRKIPNSNVFNRSLVAEEKKVQSPDEREKKYITLMFSEIKVLSSKFLNTSMETELEKLIQDATTRP